MAGKSSVKEREPPSEPQIEVISLEEEMKRSYLDYAMSVIISRALPDVRDGLKPVQRRILYAMNEGGYVWNRAHRKSARIVGDVMGKYHPHGDQSIYDALARMAQPFSMRVLLLDGHGNFGSLDGDLPAAMRYTEIRLATIAQYMLEDIDRQTVDFHPNYDESEMEPEILPARIPHLLMNGAGGIAVGMATNIPPHNPGEVIEAALALMKNPDLDESAIAEIIKGPDFPTGGVILGRKGIESAYQTGRGSVIIRAKTTIETLKGNREAIIVNEMPYQVNKATMIQKIAELVKLDKIEGIANLRDESDRDGVRVVIEISRDSQSDIVLNQLWRATSLQTSFGVNMLALVNGRPSLLTPKIYLEEFIAFRKEVILRRTRFELARARERAHILAGLAIALAHIDEVIQIIKTAQDAQSARAALQKPKWAALNVKDILTIINDNRYQIAEDGTYQLSLNQAKAILDLRLNRLTALGREEISDEVKALAEKIKDFLNILGSRERLIAVIKAELEEVYKKLDSPRRTEIIAQEAEMIDEDDLVQSDEIVVTVSQNGFIKRASLDNWRTQKRGGKGRTAMVFRDQDVASDIFIANTKDRILFFSSLGKVYQMKAWRVPQGASRTKGRAMANLFPIAKNELITSVMLITKTLENKDNLFVTFATRKGYVRRNRLSDFMNIHRGGKIAMKCDTNDGIVSVCLCQSEDDLMLTTKKGSANRFSLEDVRVFSSRNSSGVIGIKLDEGDEVISMNVMNHMKATIEERDAYLQRAKQERQVQDDDDEYDDDSDDDTLIGDEFHLTDQRYEELKKVEQFVFALSAKGYGKRTSSYAYRLTKRGGKGMKTIQVSARNGDLIDSFPVNENDEIMVITDDGQAIRCPISNVRITGRATIGVKILDTSGQISSVTRIDKIDDDIA